MNNMKEIKANRDNTNEMLKLLKETLVKEDFEAFLKTLDKW